MAANSSSCAVCARFQPSVTPPRFGIYQHRAVAVVPAQPQQAGLSGAVVVQSLGESAHGTFRRAGDGVEDVAGGRRPASMPVYCGCIEPCTTPHTPGIKSRLARDRHDAGGGAHDIHDIALANAGPIASQCASNAPTGTGMPARRPKRLRPTRAPVPGQMVAGGIRAAQLGAHAPASSGSTAARKSSGGSPPSSAIPHPLVAHGADAALQPVYGSVMPHSDRRDHVAVLQRRDHAARACPGCAAASAAAWRSPTLRSRRRRTSRSPRSRARAPSR